MEQVSKKVFIYLRVSTNSQDTSGQRATLIEYCQRVGWEIVDVFEEKISGTHMNRPALKLMNEKLWKGEAEIVLCTKLDRVFRSSLDALTLLQEWNQRGIAFVSIGDPGFNMLTPSGRLMIQLISAFAEFEASLIRSRVRAGLEHAKAKGVRLGRPPRNDVGEIVKMRQRGMTLKEIGKRVKLTESAISKILKSRLENNPSKNISN